MKKTLLFTVLGLATAHAFAQEVQMTAKDSLEMRLEKLETASTLSKKLQISGYIQAQYQIADSAGIASFAGGNMPADVDKRFAVRRGRIKFVYDGGLAKYVLQLDATEGGVGIKEAYVKVTEPWTKYLSLSVGVFDRPFGYEVSYSSSLRESPEFARLSQIIFPKEQDLGAMLTFEGPKGTALDFLRLDVAMMNGTGGQASDFDFQKDLITHLTLKHANKSETIKYSGGVSYYYGGNIQPNQYSFVSGFNNLGDKSLVLDTTVDRRGHLARKTYYGADAQVTIDWAAGLTTLRAEYIQGQQVALLANNASLTAAPVFVGKQGYAIRPFMGAYFYLVQNIATTPFQAVVKYDIYDPNTKVSGNEIVASSKIPNSNPPATVTTNLGAADVKYTTLGLGLAYRFDANTKFTAYYDIVKNEKTQLAGYTKDLRDNMVTLRVQYKF